MLACQLSRTVRNVLCPALLPPHPARTVFHLHGSHFLHCLSILPGLCSTSVVYLPLCFTRMGPTSCIASLSVPPAQVTSCTASLRGFSGLAERDTSSPSSPYATTPTLQCLGSPAVSLASVFLPISPWTPYLRVQTQEGMCAMGQQLEAYQRPVYR